MIKYNLNLSIDQLVGLHYEPKKIKYNFSTMGKKIYTNMPLMRREHKNSLRPKETESHFKSNLLVLI